MATKKRKWLSVKLRFGGFGLSDSDVADLEQQVNNFAQYAVARCQRSDGAGAVVDSNYIGTAVHLGRDDSD